MSECCLLNTNLSGKVAVLTVQKGGVEQNSDLEVEFFNRLLPPG